LPLSSTKVRQRQNSLKELNLLNFKSSIEINKVLRNKPIFFLVNPIFRKHRVSFKRYLKFLQLDIMNLNLSLPFYSCLKNAKIHTLKQLIFLSSNDLFIFSNELDAFFTEVKNCFNNYFDNESLKLSKPWIISPSSKANLFQKRNEPVQEKKNIQHASIDKKIKMPKYRKFRKHGTNVDVNLRWPLVWPTP